MKVPNAIVAELAGHTSTAMVDRHYSHLDARSAELLEAASLVRKKSVAELATAEELPATESS